MLSDLRINIVKELSVASSRADIVIHPVRFRIIQMLMSEELSTKQLAQRLADVPTSSLYRHMKILLDAGFLKVKETKLVQGIQEKVYGIDRSPVLALSDFEGVTAAEHLNYFTIYLMTLIRGFSDYLAFSSDLNFLADHTGYTEVIVWASPEELNEFAKTLNQALSSLRANEENKQRNKQKIAIVTHPVKTMRHDDG